MKFPVYTESATVEFSCFSYYIYFVVGARERLLHNIYFQCHFNLYHLSLLYYVFDYPPQISFIIFSIGVPCCFETPPLGLLKWPPSCDQYLSSCMFMACIGSLCCIRATKSNSCFYTYSPLDPLATAVFASFIANMVALSFWFSCQQVAFLLQPLG